MDKAILTCAPHGLLTDPTHHPVPVPPAPCAPPAPPPPRCPFPRSRQLSKAGQRKALGEPAYYRLNRKRPAVFDRQAGRQPGRIGKAVI